MNDTHGAFDDILGVAASELRPICVVLRRQITSLHAGAVAVVWPRQGIASFGVGPKKMSQHYAYIAVQASHVNLGFYHGASLPDPDGLLEGTGKRLRHIKICNLSSAKSASVAKLLRAAIADRTRNTSDD